MISTNLENVVRQTNVSVDEATRIKCPECSHTRKKKTERTMSVTLKDNKYLYNCWHCGISGSVGMNEPTVFPARKKLPPVIPDNWEEKLDNKTPKVVKDFVSKRGFELGGL